MSKNFDGFTDHHQLTLGESFIWQTPATLKAPLEGYPAINWEIIGPRDIAPAIGHVSVRLNDIETAVFNALQLLAERNGREQAHSRMEIFDLLIDPELQMTYPYSNSLTRTADKLDRLADVNGVTSLIQRGGLNGGRGSGSHATYRFHPGASLSYLIHPSVAEKLRNT